MNVEKRGKSLSHTLLIYVLLVIAFRFLAFFWYIKAPTQQIIFDDIRKAILGDSTRIFGLLAVYMISCVRKENQIRNGRMLIFCLFCYSMGKSNALAGSWIIRNDLITVFGFLLTGYYGAALIDSMRSKVWAEKQTMAIAICSTAMIIAIYFFYWKCAIIVFASCCLVKKIFFLRPKMQLKWNYVCVRMILRVCLLTFFINFLVRAILLISALFHFSVLISSTFLDILVEGILILILTEAKGTVRDC